MVAFWTDTSSVQGLSDEHYSRLEKLAERTVIFHATNFSPGVAALAAILRFASPLLKSLAYSPQVIETHHIHKLDAPSGTAKTIREVIDPDNPDSVNIHSVREGEVIGRHAVEFSGIADKIVIGHDAGERSLFARGAIDAALWLNERDESTGIYTMDSYFAARFGK